MKMPSMRTRAYIYRVIIALGSAVALWGILSGEQLASLLGIAAAVLNILPAANTSTRGE
jgi:hypothetical protein